MRYLRQRVIYLIYFLLFALFLSCGDSNEDTNVEIKPDGNIEEPKKQPDTISVLEMKTMMNEPGNIILDIRTMDEYDKVNIKNTLNLDYNSDLFEENITFLDKQMTYLVLSDSNEKSGNAVTKLRAKGYNSILIKDGIEALK